jgi:RNA polymerase sigma-70 factor (ECF subfamily)
MPASVATNPSIFLRLKQSDAAPREFAWAEFHGRYAPIIGAFARRLGAREQDVDDVVQDVMIGFFSTSPTFVYDPGKGRFRGYLKVCTYRATKSHLGKAGHIQGVPLDRIDPDALAVEQVWSDVWEQDLLARAIEQLRAKMGHTKTFEAFEQYVGHSRPAQEVADQLEIHLTTVYHAKEQVTRLLRETMRGLDEEE